MRILKNFREEYRPKQNLPVEEAMVAFKGQLSMKQYLSMKTVKGGIKIWECADSNGLLNETVLIGTLWANSMITRSLPCSQK